MKSSPMSCSLINSVYLVSGLLSTLKWLFIVLRSKANLREAEREYYLWNNINLSSCASLFSSLRNLGEKVHVFFIPCTECLLWMCLFWMDWEGMFSKKAFLRFIVFLCRWKNLHFWDFYDVIWLNLFFHIINILISQLKQFKIYRMCRLLLIRI